ncbi:GNAT family N-acetyltransferase [bacterium]|nr:GNAT family N-acetyltransferase [bacterium]
MLIRNATIEDAAGIARVAIDTWRTAYRGLMDDEYLDNTSYERSEQGWQRGLAEKNCFTFVATDDDGRIIGFAHAGPERDGDPTYKCELYALYVLQEYQGRGIGKALFDKVAERFTSDGTGGMIIWVLTENKSRMFYEHINGRFIRRKTLTIGGRELEASAYGWDTPIES